jgi:hypothetical protein
MLQINVTKEMILKATQRDLDAGPAYKGASIAEGKGRFYGFLGEEIVHATMPGLQQENTKDYDFRFGNFTFDVKTKTRKDMPELWYDATVDKSASHQNPYFYIFVSIMAPQNLIRQNIEEIRNFDYKRAWILGFLPRETFYERARFFNAGDVDPSNGIKYRDGIYLVRINQLKDARTLVKSVQAFSKGA